MELEKNTEDAFVNYLMRHGYPKDSIALEWGDRQCAIDIAILSEDQLTPIAIFEVKNRKSQQTIQSGIAQLVRASKLLDLNVRCSLVFRKDTDPFFEIVDVTAIIYNREELNVDSIMSDQSDRLPISYKNISLGVNQKALLSIQTKKQKRIDRIKPLCWIVIPAIAVILLVLDKVRLFELNTERLLVLGVTLIVILIPFFSEISIKDFSLKRAKNKSEEE